MMNATAPDRNAMDAILSQGDAFLAGGNPGKALDSYSTAIRLDDRCAEAYIRIGDIMMHMQRPGEAIPNLEQAHIIDETEPRYAELLHSAYAHICEVGLKGRTDNQQYRAACLNAMTGFGEVFRVFSKHDRSIAIFSKLLRQYPKSFMLHYKLGSAYLSNGDLQDARRHFARAIKLAPEFAEASASLALVYERLGKTDKGLAAVAPFIEKGTSNAGINLAFAKLQQQQGNHEIGLEQIEQSLQDRDTELQNAILLHFQAGKMCDSAGQYDRAFEHYRQGNELKAGEFDHDKVRQLNDGIIERYSRERLDEIPHLDNNSERPIFIIGMPRSATSLTEQILHSHSGVHAGGESRALPEVEKLYRQDPANADLAGLADEYCRRIGYPDDTSVRVTDKMMLNYKRLYLIELLFPHARIIHCTRNPLDNCLSIYFSNFSRRHFYCNRLEDLGVYYREYRRMMAHWEGVIRNPVYTLSYETLVADPEVQTRKLLEFCNLEWEDGCLKFFESKRYVHTTSYDQVRKPIYSGSVERWRNYEHHLQPLIDAIGDTRAA